MKTTKPMLEYLATCSKVSLESFELARLNERANLRKEMVELLDELIEVDIQARIAEWLLTQRRLQAAAMQRAPRRLRRNRSGESASLPLLPMTNEAGRLGFPALGANRVTRVLRDAADDSLASFPHDAVPVAEKTKRIA